MNVSTLIFLILVSVLGYSVISIYFFFNDNRQLSILTNTKLIKTHYGDKLIIDDSIDRNFWFVQLSDLHLSIYNDKDRSKDLLKFCSLHLHKLKPTYVLVSGDLADSKTRSALNSRQHIEEWQRYRSILESSGALNITTWLDIRGNHDSFNVPSKDSPYNLFRSYSVQGKYTHQSYKFTHKTSFGEYSFVGIDICPDPGLKRPYNFFGIVSQHIADQMKQINAETKHDNMTFWFGHYPSSTVISPNIDFRKTLGENAICYMCGHLHTLLHTVPRMYTLQIDGYLELELADWRDTRTFRVGVIDHDIFSFSDVKMNEFPVIIISNPKDAKFILPHKESVHRIANSTHIRVFVWSLANEFDVEVTINNQFLGKAKRVLKEHPLHVLAWNPQNYKSMGEKSNPHHITVTIREDGQIVKKIDQIFSIEGMPHWEFNKWPSIILMGNVNLILRSFYYILWYSMLIFLVTFRYIILRKSRLFAYQDNPWIVATLRFASNNRLFYPLIGYLLYSISCPLLVTELIDGHWGLVMLHGVYISNHFVPEASPFLSELCQNLTFVMPLIFIIIRNIRYDDIYINSTWRYLWRQWFYLCLIAWQLCIIVYWTLLPYGWITTLLSPCRFHVLTLSFYLITSARHTKKLHASFYNDNQYNNQIPNLMFHHRDMSFSHLDSLNNDPNSN